MVLYGEWQALRMHMLSLLLLQSFALLSATGHTFKSSVDVTHTCKMSRWTSLTAARRLNLSPGHKALHLLKQFLLDSAGLPLLFLLMVKLFCPMWGLFQMGHVELSPPLHSLKGNELWQSLYKVSLVPLQGSWWAFDSKRVGGSPGNFCDTFPERPLSFRFLN